MWGVLQGTAAAEGTGRNARPYPSSVSAIAHSAHDVACIVQAVFLAVGFVVAVLLLAPHRDAGAAGDLYRSPMLLTPINCKLAARTLLGVSVSSRRSGSTGGGGRWGRRRMDRALALLALSFDFPDHPGFHWVNVSRGRSGLLVNTGQTFAINGQCERISGRAGLPRCLAGLIVDRHRRAVWNNSQLHWLEGR